MEIPLALLMFVPTGAAVPTELVGEASTLGLTRMPSFLDVKCHTTGRVDRFILADEERSDGEVVAWHYRCASAQPVKKLVIFND